MSRPPFKPKIDAAQVKRDAHGKWPSILQTLGVDKAYLTNRHGPCPMCGDGTDRYRFDDRGDGRWFCSQCPKESGDGFSLLMGVHGWKFGEALEEVAKVVGTAKAHGVRQGRPLQVAKAAMLDTWRAAGQLGAHGFTALWWSNRTGQIPMCGDLRAHPGIYCQGVPHEVPAMLAKVRDKDGNWVTMHRTYLTEHGEKADVPSQRAMWDITLPDGGAVRLAQPSDVLGVAEGIETAEACRVLFGIPTWAVLTAGNLKKFTPPKEGLRIVVFGDNDASLTGQEAAYSLAKSLKARKVTVEVRIPEREGDDWNDVLRRKLKGGELVS